jgi:malonate transporter
MLENLIFIIKVVLPVFLLVIVGIVLKIFKIVDDNFVDTTSKFVFKVSLPVFIFLKLHQVDLERTYDTKLVLIILFGTVLIYLISYVIARLFKLDPEREGVFVQGAFRGNYAIVGLAIILGMFGTEALAKASLLLLIIIPMYNFLAVIALSVPFRHTNKMNVQKTLLEIFTNPLIIAALVALPISYFKIELASPLITTGNYLASIALPLALVGIGGSLNIQSAKEASQMALISSFLKNVLSPVLILPAAYYLGIKGTDLGILFVIFGCPTAIASFVMAAGMKSNIKLAGNIIIISTIGSIFTMIAGLFLLKYLQLI